MNPPKLIAGIDPGLTGAIVWSKDGRIIYAKDMPVMAKLTGKGNQVNPVELARLLQLYPAAIAYVEKVHAMPEQGVSSVFQFGHGVGIIHGVLAALHIPMTLVTPMKWKRHCGIVGKSKDAARSLAITNHPYIANELSRKKDIGRADAICICDYGNHLESQKK